MKRQKNGTKAVSKVVLTIGTDRETVGFIKENMDAIAANLVRVKEMKAAQTINIEESAQLFQNNLQPLFSVISATANEHVLDSLSLSLRKALLLMAMERYGCDGTSICRALGITKAKLEKELKRCGLPNRELEAA